MSPDSEPTPRVPWLPVNEGAQPAAPAIPEPFEAVVPAWIRPTDLPDDEASAEDAPDQEAPATPVDPPSAAEMFPSHIDETLEEPDEPPMGFDPWRGSSVELLGGSAVANAALSAAGAPTPLGGVPTVPADQAIALPSFGEESPPFTPAFAYATPPISAEADSATTDSELASDDADPAQAEPTEGAPASELTSRQRADALAAGILAHEQASLASSGTTLDGGVAYAPRSFGTPPSVEPATDTAQAPPASGTRKRRWWLWGGLALLAIIAAVVVVLVLNRPDPTVVPGVTVTLPAPTPSAAPIAGPTATPFQSALPTTVGMYVLVEAIVLDPADLAATSGRVVDGVDLTYRADGVTMTVRALQYYNEDEAKAMFTQVAGEAAATEPVEAGGVTVGESAPITSPSPGMVWRNGTSVFILTGPAAQVPGFYEDFGL